MQLYRTTIAVLLAPYRSLVRLRRYTRVHNLTRKHGVYTRSDSASMVADQGQAILQQIAELEFPLAFSNSLVFASLKSYGIPTISSLLDAICESYGQTATTPSADMAIIA